MSENRLESDFEVGESFPLLEPEPLKDSICLDKNQFPVPFYRSKAASVDADVVEENGLSMEPNRYQSDCETCQKNWDLLNRNQESHVDPLFKTKETALTRRPVDACLNFDLDGLLPSVDEQQVRLGQILLAKEVSRVPLIEYLTSAI